MRRHQGSSVRPTTRSLTRWDRAKSTSAAAGSEDLSRTTSAPSSRALSMFPSRCRCASESIFSGDSDKTEEGDHGIGLSDVKATVQAAGGGTFPVEVSLTGDDFEIARYRAMRQS